MKKNFIEYVFDYHKLDLPDAILKTKQLKYNQWYGNVFYHFSWSGAPDYCYITELEGLLAAQDPDFCDLSKWHGQTSQFLSSLTGGVSKKRQELVKKYKLVELQNIFENPGVSKDDGKTHINVYSKGRTELGRLLSNWAHTPFKIKLENGNKLSFKCVEGYWYYVLTGDTLLCNKPGYEAKKYGKSIWKEKAEPVTKEQLKLAYKAKLDYNPKIKELLLKNNLPLKHYYIFGDKIVEPKQFQWTVDLWEEIKKELKRN